MSGKAWGGRFTGATNADVERFTESIHVDHRLWEVDIQASTAHAHMLTKTGIITVAEGQALVAGLARIGERLRLGQVEFKASLEDIHMHIEAALIADLGDIGRKLHTGRSRNDQVATDLRLWVRSAIDRVIAGIRDLQKSLLAAADRHQHQIIPAYTHWQRAQPVLAAHYFVAYIERLERDRERLANARLRVNRLPLGTAALAGTSLPIDRDFVAEQLGFDTVTSNSLDTSGDRDFALESVNALSILALHLAGWADEWIIWMTSEFAMLRLPDALCTGSSIMPQKRNPDVLELVRGKSAAIMAAAQQLTLLTYKLPLAYSRDLQEDKRPLFEAFDGCEALLAMMRLVTDGATLDRGVIEARLEQGYMDATVLMEHLIKNRIPMRQAHEIVGKAVARAESLSTSLAGLSSGDWLAVGMPAAINPGDCLGISQAVGRLQSFGSSGPQRVEAAVAAWRQRLAGTERNQGNAPI